MTVAVGFILLSHGTGGQLLRLSRILSDQYDNPPIVVHHDFGQALVDTSEFASNVRFVQPHLSTGWGKFSLVQASLAALRMLQERSEPDWFFHLSAQDYPVMPGAQVREALGASDCDAFIDLRSDNPAAVPTASIVGLENPELRFFSSSSNREMKRRFYRAPQLWVPVLRLRPRVRLGKMTFRPNWDGSHPYGPGFECFYGDHWFAANRRVANLLINPTEQHLALQRHLSNRPFPDESYYQTVLGNEPGLRLCRDNRRFARWVGGSHPRTLTSSDVRDIVSSKAFFARKFEADTEVLDLIDEQLSSSRTDVHAFVV